MHSQVAYVRLGTAPGASGERSAAASPQPHIFRGTFLHYTEPLAGFRPSRGTADAAPQAVPQVGGELTSGGG